MLLPGTWTMDSKNKSYQRTLELDNEIYIYIYIYIFIWD